MYCPWCEGNMGMGWAGWLAGLLLVLLLVGAAVVVIGLIVWAVVRSTRRGGAGGPGAMRGEPLEILKERYARGELTREEYEERRRDLEA